MAKKYKCQWCDKSFERKDLIKHIEKNHSEMIPEGYDSARIVYNQVNKVDHGKCRVCGNPTGWNQKGGRYDVLCGNPKCKQKMRDDYKRNMLRVRGTYNILNDPEQQTKMLANRKISGTYTFQDGGTLTYTGSYEKKCLEFMDVFMNIPSKDILSPGPTLEYEYNGKKHFYISDFYYIPYNLIIEVKDGGDNLNKKSSVGMDSSREKTLEKERIITDRGEYNYIRLTNNEFAQLVEVFMTIKQKLLEGDDSKTYRINESVAIEESFDNFDEYYDDYQAIIKTDKLKECVKRERVMNEACKDVDTARKFVSDVAKIAKKYDANYFIVTDGASGIHNKGNDAVKHARDSHIEWEKENGHDPYEDWSKGKKSVKEGMFEPSDDDNPFTPWDKGLFKQIAILNKTLTKFKYGYVRNGKVIENFSAQEFYQNYRTMTPQEFERYRGGVSWDYVTYEADYFKEALNDRVKYETYFICYKDDMDDPTHSFLIFKWGYLWYWFESSDKMIAGIYGFKKKDNLLDYVINKCKSPEYRPKQTILIPYNANDITGGLTARQYYVYMYTRYYDAITIKPDKYYKPDIIYK